MSEIEEMIRELMDLRRDAKEAARSGDPAIRAEAKVGIEQCNEHLAYLRGRLANADQ